MITLAYTWQDEVDDVATRKVRTRKPGPGRPPHEPVIPGSKERPYYVHRFPDRLRSILKVEAERLGITSQELLHRVLVAGFKRMGFIKNDEEEK